MIDFRYHLVSLIAVFLAVALGIVIGTTQLNGPVTDNLRAQVIALERDKRNLEDSTRQLQAEQSSDEAFQAAVAPILVDGALPGGRVLLVVTNDGISTETVEEVSALVGQAGGRVTGTVSLQPGYSDPASSATLGSYLNGAGLPAGIQLPETGNTAQQVAALLADVLMVPPKGTPPGAAAVSAVLAGLSALEVIGQDSAAVTPADYAILLTSGGFRGSDADQRNTTLVQLAAALDAAGSGAVVAGDPASAADTGLVGAVRNDPTTSAAVSTVDNVDTPAGQVSAVLALGQERGGASGKYGAGEGTQPVPPVPSSTR